MDEPSVKLKAFPSHAVVELKSATGVGFTTAVILIDPLQPPVSVTFTPYVPALFI